MSHDIQLSSYEQSLAGTNWSYVQLMPLCGWESSEKAATTTPGNGTEQSSNAT